MSVALFGEEFHTGLKTGNQRRISTGNAGNHGVETAEFFSPCCPVENSSFFEPTYAPWNSV
jgi:hypothetical protein